MRDYMIRAYGDLPVNPSVKREVRSSLRSRREIKKVYDNVIDLNKRMPFYKINLSQENQDYSIRIKEAAYKLRERIKDMARAEISGFDSKAIVVSDESILSASLLDQDVSELPDTMEFKIETLAAAQINKGRDLFTSSRGLASGVYEFRARVGSKSQNLIFYQRERKDNYTVLTEMADLLNSSIQGVTATIEKGAIKDYYRLSITADVMDENGERLVFEDIDEDPIGIVDYLGMNRMEKPPTLAEFEINGVARRVVSNNFKLSNKLYITINEAGREPAYINIVPDGTKIIQSVKATLSTYNALVDVAKKHIELVGSHSSAKKLITELRGLGLIYSGELEESGIIVSEDGSLSVDEAVAAIAVREGRLQELFTRGNGYIAILQAKAEAIAVNPMEYIDKVLVTYTNPEKKNYRYPYITSMYSGLFCNVVC